jgi:hypothetical protein
MRLFLLLDARRRRRMQGQTAGKAARFLARPAAK